VSACSRRRSTTRTTRSPSPRPAHAGFHWRTWGAEAAGTALMVLAILLAASLALGKGSPVAEALPGPGARFLVLGALVAPCVALIAVSPLGRLSGAHINPAVTLGFWALGRVGRHDLAGYIGAQLLGGLAGALAARLVLPESLADSIGGAVTHPTVSTAAAVALEAGMTALLLGVVFGFVSSERLARRTPLVLLPLLTGIIWLGSPWTGASLNPARSEGPALAFGDLTDLWLYLAAPSAAGLALGFLWRGLSRRPLTGKLFHDPRYPCSLASDMPAAPADAPMPAAPRRCL
jgi:aquaporin Z